MRRLFLLLLAMPTLRSTAQVIKLNAKDQVTVVSSVINIKDSGKVKIDSTYLNLWNLSTIQETRKKLAANIHAAIESLSDTMNANIYLAVWDPLTSDSIVNELTSIEKNLNGKDYQTTVPTTSSFYQLDSLLRQMLQPSRKYYFVEKDRSSDSYLQVNIKKEHLFNTFLVRYYNLTIGQKQNKAIASLDSKTYQGILKRAGAQMNWLRAVIDSAGKNTKDYCFGRALYDAADNYDTYISNDEISIVLHAPFLKQWIWRNNGALRVNPLDFITEKLSVNHQETDGEKAGLFNTYLDSLVKRYIRYDSTGHIDKFKELLNNMRKGDQLYTTGILPVQVKAAYDSILHSIATNVYTANRIHIPYTDTSALNRYIQYLANEALRDPRASKLNPLTLDDRIFISVHNIGKNEKVRLVKFREEKIEDKSPFHQGLDSGLAQLGSAIRLFNPASNFLVSGMQALNKISRSMKGPKITPTTSDTLDNEGLLDVVVTGLWKKTSKNYTRENFITALKTKIKNLDTLPDGADSCLDLTYYSDMHEAGFNDSLFHEIISINESAIKNLFIGPYSEHKAKVLRDKLIIGYLQLVIRQKVLPALVNILRIDSLQLAFMTDAFSRSSIPSPPIDTLEDDSGPLLRSEISVTDYMDDPSKLEYRLVKQSKTDSVNIGSFTYKTGKRYRFQLGAGLAYTVHAVTVNDVKSDSGKVSVSSSEQRFQFIVGAHFYPFNHGIFLQDKSFGGRGANAWSRVNFLVAVSIPAPLDNFYLGAGYDLGPALRINAGLHLYKYKKFTVQNNEVLNQSTIYKTSFPFISITLDPSSILKAVGILKN